ncbi:hypothetical protein Drose_12115 [Dactylosporangium roseum]|uniref:Uncharacterized protein n=1 Tax=Dactylosporangium roseum TaxID=47989 RepID=A0ABY5ZD39_9ACTN|nr:hypothetical protein [Dactylosporangium roseum]UWZ38895.1 hypothetical protein Drose_12115 [Dactylosporangium roseum]
MTQPPPPPHQPGPPGRPAAAQHAAGPARHQAAPPQQRRAAADARPAVVTQPPPGLETGQARQAVPWQAQATASAQAAASVAAPEEALTARPAPTGPPPEARQGPATARGERHKALSHRLPALHVGWHAVSSAMLRGVTAGGGATGLLLGVDYQRQPVSIRFFRPQATRVTLVGGLWAARILVFRALALGARAVVMTGDPRSWQGLGEWATGMADRMVLWNDPRPPAVPANARQPLLVVDDAGTTGGVVTPKPQPGPWQTQVTVLRHLGPENAHALQGSNLVMLQRLSAPEAAVAGSALNLTEQGAGLLQEMAPEMLALMGSDANRYIWLAPTSIEQQYHGPPQR